MFAPPSTKGEQSTGWLRRQKARMAPSIISSQTRGELPLQLPVTTGVCLHDLLAEQDRAHLHDVLGVLRRGRHAHERLVGILHGRIGDAQVPVADHHVHRLDDVMGGRVQRRRHVRELVEHGEVGERRPAPHVVEVADEGRARHRHEDRVRPAEVRSCCGVARAVGEGRGDRRDEFPHEAAVEMDALAPHVRAGARASPRAPRGRGRPRRPPRGSPWRPCRSARPAPRPSARRRAGHA